MVKLRINPLVVDDLKEISDYIAEDNKEWARKTVTEICDQFQNIQLFPNMGTDLSKRVSFKTDYKFLTWNNYVIIYKALDDAVEIYRVINRYRDITRIFDV